MSVSPIPFKQALLDTDKRRRHLLLGNGFSIEAYPAFDYRSLADLARELEPTLSRVFAAPLSDFERAMSCAPADASLIKDGLIKAIIHTHPKWADVASSRKDACAEFLAKFLRASRKRGTIFTTNYDMMLYWVLMRQRKKLRCSDDFNRITQKWEGGLQSALIYYLHGALHLYQRPSGSRELPTIRKLTASSSADLIDSIREALSSGETPIFISEGTAEEKWAQIRGNNYLRSAFQRFMDACSSPNAVLFTFGHGLSIYDRHVTAQICKGQMEQVYIGTYSKRDVERVAELADGWAEWRGSRRLPQIQVRTFHVAEAEVWRAD